MSGITLFTYILYGLWSTPFLIHGLILAGKNNRIYSLVCGLITFFMSVFLNNYLVKLTIKQEQLQRAIFLSGFIFIPLFIVLSMVIPKKYSLNDSITKDSN